MGILAVSATVGENANFGKNGDFGENWENGENQENQDLAKMSRSAKKADFWGIQKQCILEVSSGCVYLDIGALHARKHGILVLQGKKAPNIGSTGRESCTGGKKMDTEAGREQET